MILKVIYTDVLNHEGAIYENAQDYISYAVT